MAKFSIIVPVYNVAEYLRASMDSLVCQTCTDWEAICVDDGSTDDSGAILDEYAAKDSRFSIVHQQNGGVSAARNSALEMASGEWIVFLDGDDFYTPNMLVSLLRGMSANPRADMVLVGLQLWRVRTQYVPEILGEETVRLFDVSAKIPDGLWRGFTQYAYRRSVCGDVRFERHVIGEDLLYLATNLCRVSFVSSVNVVGYVYRQREGSAMRSDLTTAKLRDIFLTYDRVLSVVMQSGKSSGIANMITGSLIEYCSSGVVKIPFGENRTAIVNDWCNALSSVLRFKGVRGLDVCRIKMLCNRRDMFSILILAYFPYILRRRYEEFKALLKKIPCVHKIVLLRRKARIAKEMSRE